ncbi:hypothetical protein [Candidatus Pelagibacter sp. Uisw_134_02]|uniref:hypothetical protein n=1 Tax=Candidatus Pelagibacter sp. Uisw_134_02 TaxID=3230990 RepID=UPI0039E8185E
MKRLILILILTLSLQSWTKADDISDFEVERMSVGDSLLDLYSEDEIKENTLPYFKSKRKYYVVGIIDNLKKYDQVEIYLKSNDKSYEIKTILAGVFSDDFNKCINDKKEIVKKLDKIFINVEKMSDSKNHEADPTGNSKQNIDQYNINYPDHIRVECTKFSQQMKNDGLARNSLNIVVMSKEINDWIASGYK